jgi:hypothetical protein
MQRLNCDGVYESSGATEALPMSEGFFLGMQADYELLEA